jgi:TonB family protein
VRIPGRRPSRAPRSTGFWTRPDVRKYLPVAIGGLAIVLLALTLAVAPGRRRPSAEFAAIEVPAESARISEERVALRKTADSRSASLAILGRGEAVTVEEQKGTWCRVRDAGGREGYLPRRSVERASDLALRRHRGEAILKFAPLAGDVADDTPLLLAPFSFAPLWGNVERGASLSIYSVDHGYYAVKLPDETLGFVDSEDVDIIPANPSEPVLASSGGRVVKGISVSEREPPPSEPPPPVPGGPAAPEPPPGMPGSVAVPAEGAAGEPGEVAPAVLIEKVDPVYPSSALGARVAGTVVLQVTIDRLGNVTRIDTKRAAPLGMTDAAIAAVERWRYKPALGPGGPISSMKLVRIEFKPPQ